MRFKQFLLHENTVYLAQRVGDVLNALQELEQNSQGMGTRQLVHSAETVVNQIRRILHTSWSKEEEVHLKTLQKVGVGIMRAIEEKDDLASVISACSQELQKVTDKIGEPVNQIGTPEGKEVPPDEEQEDQTSKPEGEDKQQPQPQQPQQPPQQPDQTSGLGPPEGAGVTQPGALGQPPQMPGITGM